MKFISSFILILLIATGSLLAQQKKTHTVRAGETLYSIAKSLEVTVTELKAWNSLAGNAISVGQDLVYYVDGMDVDAPPQDIEEPVEPINSLIKIDTPPQNMFYTVKSGDNLTVIARRHSMSIRELKELNGLDTDFLRVGQRLTVRKVKDSVAPSAASFDEKTSPQGAFVIYSIESGDDIQKILSRFEMKERELRELNPDINFNALRSGQKITVLLPPNIKYENPYTEKGSKQFLGEVETMKYESALTGNATTSGELYNPEKLTAAHSNIALGTVLFLEHPENGRGIYVRVNDRMIEGGLKLSAEAYRILDLGNSERSIIRMYSQNNE